MSTIQIEKPASFVRLLRLNRPEAYNSFTREMAMELLSALRDADESSDIRIVCLTGAGKAFCAGQDLKEVSNPETNIGFERIVDEHYNAIIRTLQKMDTPVIAWVNGVAAGAGANIALACDIVIASESASFIQAFSKIGLIPDSGGTYILPRLVGFGRARALALLGEKLSAADAEDMGMIYAAVPDEEGESYMTGIARKLAELPPKGLSYTKRLFAASTDNTLDEQLELEKEYQVKAGATDDYNECVQAFLEKRKPRITGK